MYIYSGSFAHNEKDSDFEVIERLAQFSDLTNKVGEKYREDNRFFANYTELNDTVIFSDGTTFSSLLFGTAENKSHDLEQAFYLILSQGYLENTDIPCDEINELITQNSDMGCNAKVVLSRENVYQNENCIIATYQDWLSYRSYLLGRFPATYESFFEECERYYEHLVLSKDFQSESQQVLKTHSSQICQILYCMNTYLIKELEAYKGNRIDFPHFFAKKYNIEDGSFQGDGDTKRKYLTMNFPDGKKICEAHFKYNTINGRKVYNDVRDCCRIYFAIPKDGDECIYIGAILNHTKQCN